MADAAGDEGLDLPPALQRQVEKHVEHILAGRASAIPARGGSGAGGDGDATFETEPFDNPLTASDADVAGSTGAGGLAGSVEQLFAVRHMIMSMKDRPANLHQVTILLALDPKAPGKKPWGYLFASLVVVMMQLFTCRGISAGAKYQSCAHSDDCEPGRFCNQLVSGGNGDCVQCVAPIGGSGGAQLGPVDHPKWAAFVDRCSEATPQYCILNSWAAGNCGATVDCDPTAPTGPDSGFSCPMYNVSNARQSCSLANHSKYANGMGGDICTRCFDPMMAGDHWNLGRYDGWRVHDALSRMRPTDFVSLVLVSLLIGLSIGAELRESSSLQISWCPQSSS